MADEPTVRRRLSMWAVRGRPLWRPLRIIAEMTVIAGSFLLLASAGWSEWLGGLFIAAAAFNLGAMTPSDGSQQVPHNNGGTENRSLPM